MAVIRPMPRKAPRQEDRKDPSPESCPTLGFVGAGIGDLWSACGEAHFAWSTRLHGVIAADMWISGVGCGASRRTHTRRAEGCWLCLVRPCALRLAGPCQRLVVQRRVRQGFATPMPRPGAPPRLSPGPDPVLAGVYGSWARTPAHEQKVSGVELR